MAHKLVIVESPAKARTIGGYLGQGYVVESSIGHIRDLPNSAADTPAKIKDKPWGRLAVDVDNGFEPYYVVPRDKKAHISKLKALLKDADELYLATDEDREGEAIAWHLLDELKPKGIPVKRMVFHEITKPRDPRRRREPARPRHGPRRGPGGAPDPRPALRLRGQPGAVEEGHVRPVRRPRAVGRDPAGRRPRAGADGASGSRPYWDLEGTFDAGAGARPADVPGQAALRRRRPRRPRLRLRPGRRCSRPNAERRPPRPAAAPRRWPTALQRHDVRRPLGRGQAVPALAVRAVPHHHAPAGGQPQARHERVGDDVGRAAALRERLHHLHAHRLHHAVGRARSSAARAQVRELYGAEYLPDAPRTYASKVKNAQEAHEAIRPAGDTFRTPAQTGLTGDQFRLYELIWMRTVASQMKDAVGQSVTIRLGGAAAAGEDVVFSAQRPGHHLPRLPQGLRRGHRRRGAPEGRRRDPAARTSTRATRSRPRRSPRAATRPSRRPATPRPR